MINERTPDHQNISFTAKLVALGRSTTAIPFAQDISELIGAPAIGRELTPDDGDMETQMAEIMAPFVEARYLSLVSAIKRSGVKQVIEFASGVSLRGLAMTLENPELIYIETDLPNLTQEKQQIMSTILARRQLTEPRHHHVAVANILKWNEIEPVLKLLVPGEPVAVVHEGLLMYLSLAEKNIAAQHIARILDQFGGVWLTPDLSPISNLNELFDTQDTAFTKFTSVIEERTGRSFADYSFNSNQEIEDFCKARGFSVEERSQLDGSYQLSSVPADSSSHILSKIQQLTLFEMRRSVH